MATKLSNCLVIVGLAAAISAIGSTPCRAERTETLEASSGQELVMDFETGGSATVKGWDKDLVEVTYSDRYRDLDDYDIHIRSTRSGIKITASLERHRDGSNALQFDIRVPRRFDVEFHSAGGGLDIIDVEGTFTGKTMGGHIAFKNAVGEARLTTMGGRIEVLNSKLDGKIHTMGGRALVEDVTGDLEVTSNGGNVQYKNVRRSDGEMRVPNGLRAKREISRETVLISTMGGSVDVEDAPDGANVSTAGGDITVTGASKFVEAATGGGDIDIRVENGWVRATTGAGDIDVVIEEGAGDNDEPIVLVTGSGDVRLTVPLGFSMELDIDLGYTRKRDGDFRIVTNLDVDEERTTNWDYDNGSPRKHIYGTGTFSGGRHKVKIRTVNGDIYLHEGR